jgi:hypothetical protein
MEGLKVVVDGAVFFPLVQIVLFVFGVIGMTHIIVDSGIFMPVRNWLKTLLPVYIYKIVECYQCSGTWCGFVVGWMVMGDSVFTVLACGFAGSFLASWAATYLNYLEAKSIVASLDDKE